MGAHRIVAFNYEYGKGASAFKPVADAARRGDWPAVAAASRAALARDAWHLDAHFQLAVASVHLGQPEVAREHFDIALAGDWLRWGPTLAERAELASFWATDAGREVAALAAAYRTEFMERVATGIWLLGRRSRYKRPSKPGEQWSATRGELYAYDEDSQRYLRLSHTRERIAGWLRSPSGTEIAWLGYWQVVVPDASRAATAPADPDGKAPDRGALQPKFRRTLVGVLDAATLVPRGQAAVLRDDITRADLHYRTDDELVVRVYRDSATRGGADADTAGPSALYTLDRDKSKLVATDVEPSDGPVLIMTWEKTWIETRAGAPEYEVTDGEDSEILLLAESEEGVALPEDVAVTGVELSPDKAYALVRTVAEPCTEPPSGSLYVVDTSATTLHHVMSGDSEFPARWLDDHRFVYQDSGARLRIHDMAQGQDVTRLHNGATLALFGLGATDGIVCPP